jgi:hypothetical protein
MEASELSKLENKDTIFHRCSWCGLYGYKLNYDKIQLPKRQEF